jgi:hypothetical protein
MPPPTICVITGHAAAFSDFLGFSAIAMATAMNFLPN